MRAGAGQKCDQIRHFSSGRTDGRRHFSAQSWRPRSKRDRDRCWQRAGGWQGSEATRRRAGQRRMWCAISGRHANGDRPEWAGARVAAPKKADAIKRSAEPGGHTNHGSTGHPKRGHAITRSVEPAMSPNYRPCKR